MLIFGSEVFHRGHFLAVLSTPVTLTLQSLAIVFVIFSVTTNREGLVYSILNHRAVTRVGVLSYSIYLWQQLALVPADAARPSFLWQQFPDNLLAAVALGWFSHYVIETPFLRLKHRFSAAPARPVVLPMSVTEHNPEQEARKAA